MLGCGFDLSETLDYTVNTVNFNTYHFHIDEEIKEPRYYRTLIDTLYTATPNDTVVLSINSDGGSLDSAVAIIEALRGSPAQTVSVIVGRCCSAASLIALSCQFTEVSEFAVGMAHSCRYGAGGSSGDIKGQAEFEHRMVEKIYRSVYQDFLSESEIQSVVNNGTIWMDNEDIINRLEQRQAKYTEDTETVEKVVDKKVKYS